MSPCRHLGRWGGGEEDGAGTLIRQLGGGGGGGHRAGVTRTDHARGESRTRTPLPAPDFESSSRRRHQNPPTHITHGGGQLAAPLLSPSCTVFPRLSHGTGTARAH